MHLLTRAMAKMNLRLTKFIGLEEERNPATGGVRWRFTHWGKVHVTATSAILKARIGR